MCWNGNYKESISVAYGSKWLSQGKLFVQLFEFWAEVDVLFSWNVIYTWKKLATDSNDYLDLDVWKTLSQRD